MFFIKKEIFCPVLKLMKKLSSKPMTFTEKLLLSYHHHDTLPITPLTGELLVAQLSYIIQENPITVRKLN